VGVLSLVLILILAGCAGPDGTTGPQGSKGTQGEAGVQGPVGPVGPAGTSGGQGLQGTTGPKGETGATGLQGVPGDAGPQGSSGYSGAPGASGGVGPAGIDGVDGVDGVDGAPGVDGIDGINGLDGTPGIDGVDGKDGVDGIPGVDGADGEKGDTGAIGPQGIQGIQGLPGPEYSAYVLLVTKDFSDWTWSNFGDTWALLQYKPAGPTFDFRLTTKGLPLGEYSLIYYNNELAAPDEQQAGKLIMSGIEEDGVWIGSVNLDSNLPFDTDANLSRPEYFAGSPDYYANTRGAKLWLVPSDMYSERLVIWGDWPVTSTRILFETDLILYLDTDILVLP